MNYKFLFFLFPLMALTQDSFLKNLWTGKSTINNQIFTLNLHGVIYQSGNRNDRYMGLDATDFFPTKDLNRSLCFMKNYLKSKPYDYKVWFYLGVIYQKMDLLCA